MPNLYKICGEVKEIKTEVRLPAISAKAVKYFLTRKLDNECSFESLKEYLKDREIVWESLGIKIAMLLFPYTSHRKPKNTFYSDESAFMSLPECNRKEYVKLYEESNRKNEVYLEKFIQERRDEFDLVIAKNDVLDAMSHIEIGLPLTKRYQNKDLMLGRLDKLCPNIIVFSDHGANHNPDGAIFGYRLPFKIEYPKSFGEISELIETVFRKLS